MCKKYLAVIVCFLTLCGFCCSSIAEASSLSKISVKVTQVSKINIHRPTTKRMGWWLCDFGKVILLAENTLEVYNESDGSMLKTYILPTEYQEVRISVDGSIFLRSKDDSHILVIRDNSFEQIWIPDQFPIWSMHLMRGMPILDLCGDGAVILKNGLWEEYPFIHYVGRDGFAYFYQHGWLNKYDENGVLVEKYNTYFDPDPGYSLGIDEKGVWFLLTEPLIDKQESIDTLEFMYLDPQKQHYGYFVVPCGNYDLGQGFTYRLEQQTKQKGLEQIIDESWPTNLVTITKWRIDLK